MSLYVITFTRRQAPSKEERKEFLQLMTCASDQQHTNGALPTIPLLDRPSLS